MSSDILSALKGGAFCVRDGNNKYLYVEEYFKEEEVFGYVEVFPYFFIILATVSISSLVFDNLAIFIASRGSLLPK